MKITLLGAAGGEVTGSAYLVQTGRANVMIDCGMFQGIPQAEEKNRIVRESNFKKLDAVLLTHAHLDHTGRLPLLVHKNYDGPVFCTPATAEMSEIILQDAARIQSSDVERTNRRRLRSGKEPLEVLYTTEDVRKLTKLFRHVDYRQAVPVADGVEATWTEAGHMLGSASIRLNIHEKGHTKSVVFSGDLGQRDAPILKGFEPFSGSDVVFLESTYGDHDHRPFKETVNEMLRIVRSASEQGGKIFIPTFAIGRAQLMIALASWMFRRKGVRPFPVCLDSPMAIEATKLYAKHPELWNEQTQNYVAERKLMDDLKPSGSRASVTPKDSRKLNDLPGPCMILAGSGMCNAGRILHHLRNNLWKDGTHVMFVGYQAPGTVGRALVDGAKTVRIFGEEIAVKATIHTLGGLSAHAGQSDLLHWISSSAKSRPRVVLTHGEDRQRKALAQLLRKQFNIDAELPGDRDVLEA